MPQEERVLGPVLDPRVRTVLDRLHAPSNQFPGGRSGRRGSWRDGSNPAFADPFARADRPLSIKQEQGDLIYLLCRAIGAKRVVDFATSVGVSAIYFAAAIRDNGGGTVIGAEIVPGKAAAAERNLAEAGLADYADIRLGDARETLADVGGPVDFALIDGFPVAEGPSLARQLIEILTPQLRVGALVLNDNGETDFLDYVRDPERGFRSLSLPLKGSTELSVKVE
ncbi:methyltransferase [Amycolatopsis acidicola]|uniref:Methyltransferase n=1 Tax=Amycolatopsis acidicola TaxID=2596893 RepID=A0A5N0V0W7_9PSEU|nr:class I SAM-dependent methyltransferase [Amycolatopsis acidicola]KAA9159071.1 methyltransferase [Amycolatopsis acidicola]